MRFQLAKVRLTILDNDLRNLIVVAIAHRIWTDARHREVVAHGGTAQSATTTCFQCLLHQVPPATANGARGSLASRLLADPIRNDSSSLCTSFTTDRITSRPRRVRFMSVPRQSRPHRRIAARNGVQ